MPCGEHGGGVQQKSPGVQLTRRGSQLTEQTEFLGCRTKWRKYDFSFLLEV